MHPRGLRCSSLKYSRYSRSSRLAREAPRPSRCDARLSPRAVKLPEGCTTTSGWRGGSRRWNGVTLLISRPRKSHARSVPCRRATSNAAPSSHAAGPSTAPASARRSPCSTPRCTFSSCARSSARSAARARREASRAFSTSGAVPAPPGPRGRSSAAAARSTASIAMRGRSRKPTGRTARWAWPDAPGKPMSIGSRCAEETDRRFSRPTPSTSSRTPTRDALLPRLIDAHAHGSRILIVEPIARRMAGWWTGWASAFTAAGGTAEEWRFGTPLPERQRQFGRAAGLDPRELTARSLWL